MNLCNEPQKLCLWILSATEVWNGGYDSTGTIVHFCKGPGCCDEEGPTSTVGKLAYAIDDVVLSRCPVQPSMGKWTQLGECLDWFMLSMAGSLFPNLFQHAMRGTLKDDSEALEGAAEGFMLDCSWHAVAGTRKRKTEANLQDPDFRARVLLLAVLIEPARRLTSFYMKTSGADLQEEQDEWPPLIDLLNPKASLIHQCLQYWSTMLGAPCDCKRLILVWKHRGCGSYKDWCTRFPADIQFLRKGALALAAAVYRRQFMYLKQSFGGFAVCDTRLPEGRRMLCAQELVSKPYCCLSPGAHRSLAKKAYDDAAAPKSTADVARALLAVGPQLCMASWFLRLSVACIERMHHSHRLLSRGGQTSYHVMCAKSVLTRIRQSWEKRQASSKKRGNSSDDPSLGNGPAPPALEFGGIDFSNLKRALSPFEVFKKRLRAQEKAEGQPARNPADEETREYYRAAFEGASIVEEVLCDDISEATKARSRLMRRSSAAGGLVVPHAPSGSDLPVLSDRPASDNTVTDIAVLPENTSGSERPELRPRLLEACQVEALFDKEDVALELHAAAPQDIAVSQSGPLSPSTLRAFYKGEGFFEGKAVRSQVPAMWQSKVHAKPPASTFPTNITYRKCCGALCQVLSPIEMRTTHNAIMRTLTKLVSDHAPKGVAKNIGGGDLFLAIRSPSRTDFLRPSEGVAQHGRWPATQMYSSLRVVKGSGQPPFVGDTLRCCRDLFEPPYKKPPSPVHMACLGPIRMLPTDSVAADFAACPPDNLEIFVLECDGTGCLSHVDEWTIVGVKEQHTMSIDDEDRPGPPPPGPDDPIAHDDDDDIAGGMVAPDFMAAFGVIDGAHPGMDATSGDGAAASAMDASGDGAAANAMGDPDEPFGNWLEEELGHVIEELQGCGGILDMHDEIEEAMKVMEAAEEGTGEAGGKASSSSGGAASSSSQPASSSSGGAASSSSQPASSSSGGAASSSSQPASSPSGGAASPIDQPAMPPPPVPAIEGHTPAADFDMKQVCDDLGLADMSFGKVWRFGRAAAPSIPIIDIHSIAREGGGVSMKATCKVVGHKKCVCWVTKITYGPERCHLLQDLMTWGSQGHVSENEHYVLAQKLKKKWGMKVKI